MHLPSVSAGKLLRSRCSWPLEQVSGWDISSLFTEKPHCDIKMLFLLGAQVIFKGNSKCSDHKSALISYKLKTSWKCMQVLVNKMHHYAHVYPA